VTAARAALAPHRIVFAPGSPAEKSFLEKEESSSVVDGTRVARANGFWIYHLPLMPGGHAELMLTIEGGYEIALSGDGISYRPAAISARRGTAILDLTPVARQEKRAHVRIRARSGEVRLKEGTLILQDRDSNRDGVGDMVERLMGFDPSSMADALPPPGDPCTSFQTPGPYRPEHDLRTDAVLVYSSEKERIQSWQERGYRVQTMYGFRAGEDYIRAYRGDVQTNREGRLLDCGPGSYYLVPTGRRIEAALRYFREAIQNGTSAICPEEPEFFARAGYSEAFKAEWQKFYKAPWEDPVSSVDARYRAEQLKAHLEMQMIQAILQEARRLKPSIRRMLAFHSPLNYANWGVIFPFSQAIQMPELDEVIGQVWTGTARTPVRYRGEVSERVFETAFLEYSSLVNLVRGTGKKLWFLMDPVEDNPDRTMEDYRLNYERTLIAALMFPQVDSFEVLPWPERILGRVPPGFATEITTLINVLKDMHRQTEARLESGTQGIATLIADSLMYQREAPSPSDFDSIWGMTLPLLMSGVPVEVAQLERAVDPEYLTPYKVLLLSYDALKPMDERVHEALAEWVRQGGVLVFLGGTDAYNDLHQSWWKAKGYKSPQEDLFARLGVKVSGSSALVGESGQDTYVLQLKADKPYRNLENLRYYSIELTPFLSGDPAVDDRERVSVYVKFQDACPEDGWGAWIRRIRLDLNDQLGVAFQVGTRFERQFLFEDGGSALNGDARFTDRDAYVVYKFDIPRSVKTAFLTVEMGNQFLVKATSRTQTATRDLTRVGSHPLSALLPTIPVDKRFSVTAYDTTAQRLYSLPDSSFAPVFEATAGRGRLLCVGVPPRFFSQSEMSSHILRTIVRYACQQTGTPYREQPFLRLTRGRYIVVRTFHQAIKIPGPALDLLNPELPVLVVKSVPKDSWALLYDVSDLQGEVPQLMYCSSAVEKKRESRNNTSLFVQGPLKTQGVARIYAGGHALKQVEAFDCMGQPVPIESVDQDETCLLRYDNLPDGIVIRMEWE